MTDSDELAYKVVTWVHPVVTDDSGRIVEATVPARDGQYAKVLARRFPGCIQCWCRHFHYGDPADLGRPCEAAVSGRPCYHIKGLMVRIAQDNQAQVRFWKTEDDAKTDIEGVESGFVTRLFTKQDGDSVWCSFTPSDAVETAQRRCWTWSKGRWKNSLSR